MTKATKHRWWLCNAVWASSLIVAQVVLAALGHAGGWLLVPTVPVAVVQWTGWRMTRPDKPALSSRTPVFPGGHGCPAGSCPICGMHDPERLVGRFHESCVEWLGYVPRRIEGGAKTVEAAVKLAESRVGRKPKAEELRAAMIEYDRSGHSSTAATIYDLPPFPDAMMEKIAATDWAAEAKQLRDSIPAPCACGQRILACPACYTPYCPVCEQRHVFDCGRKWEQQQREIETARELPPLHIDPRLIDRRKW